MLGLVFLDAALVVDSLVDVLLVLIEDSFLDLTFFFAGSAVLVKKGCGKGAGLDFLRTGRWETAVAGTDVVASDASFAAIVACLTSFSGFLTSPDDSLFPGQVDS